MAEHAGSTEPRELDLAERVLPLPDAFTRDTVPTGLDRTE